MFMPSTFQRYVAAVGAKWEVDAKNFMILWFSFFIAMKEKSMGNFEGDEKWEETVGPFGPQINQPMWDKPKKNLFLRCMNHFYFSFPFPTRFIIVVTAVQIETMCTKLTKSSYQGRRWSIKILFYRLHKPPMTMTE